MQRKLEVSEAVMEDMRFVKKKSSIFVSTFLFNFHGQEDNERKGRTRYGLV